MRTATAIAVLLSVVATALVGVREKSEICRLRYSVFELERRRDSLERQRRELEAAVADALAPRRLLVANDARPNPVRAGDEVAALPDDPAEGSGEEAPAEDGAP